MPTRSGRTYNPNSRISIATRNKCIRDFGFAPPLPVGRRTPVIEVLNSDDNGDDSGVIVGGTGGKVDSFVVSAATASPLFLQPPVSVVDAENNNNNKLLNGDGDKTMVMPVIPNANGVMKVYRSGLDTRFQNAERYGPRKSCCCWGAILRHFTCFCTVMGIITWFCALAFLLWEDVRAERARLTQGLGEKLLLLKRCDDPSLTQGFNATVAASMAENCGEAAAYIETCCFSKALDRVFADFNGKVTALFLKATALAVSIFLLCLWAWSKAFQRVYGTSAIEAGVCCIRSRIKQASSDAAPAAPPSNSDSSPSTALIHDD